MLKPPVFPECLYVENEQCTHNLKQTRQDLSGRECALSVSDASQDTSSAPLTDLITEKEQKCKTE